MVDKSQQTKAGQARAESMTASERKALATKAAHARWKKDPDGVALAEHEGVWSVGPYKIVCAVLKGGRRIFSERSLSEAFEHIRSGSEYKRRREQPEDQRLPVFVSPVVAEYLSSVARERVAKPIRYRTKDGFSVPAWGVDAEILPDLCDAYLAARDAGSLKGEAALRKAKAAERLTRALAKVGVIAIVDEVTGYQIERDKDELQRLLEKYVSEEFRRYTSRFPTEFYSQIFRLRGITTDDVRKRPAYFGRLTNDIVYERMLPGMLERLRDVNPVVPESGRRSRRHYWHLTENAGITHLDQHLAGVVFLMRAHSDWSGFIRALDRAAPKKGTTLPLPFESDDV